MSKWVQTAVDALAATLSAQLPGQLRNVEAQEGLAANALTNPTRVFKARAPMLNESPSICVYDTAWEFEAKAGQRLGFAVVDCEVVVSYTFPDADLQAGELFVRRYLTALLQMIQAYPQLNGQAGVVAAIATGGDAASAVGDRSATHFVAVINVEVRVAS